MRLYLDTAPVVYMVEQVPGFSMLVRKHTEQSDVDLIISELTRMECRVKPISENRDVLLQEYDTFFDSAICDIVGLSRQVMDQATHLRAQYKIKTPDAIHIAAAIISNCDVFLTNDYRLPKIEDIEIKMIS